MFQKLLITFHFFLPVYLLASGLDCKVSSPMAVVVNAQTGAIVYQKNAHQLHFPASTTKIATALYLLEKYPHRLDELVSFPNECLTSVSKAIKIASNYSLPPYLLEPDGTHYFIKRGEQLSFYDLLGGMLIKSGNDAANVLAHYVSGSIDAFVAELNVYLRQLGCQKTRFLNPHGLHHPNHVTTAYELALISQKAMKNPIFRDIVRQSEWLREATNKQPEMTLSQSNKLLCKESKFYYQKAIGIKIGYTYNAKSPIVAAATNEDRTLIVVLLGCEDSISRYRDTINLFETAFHEKKVSRCLYNRADANFSMKVPGGKNTLTAGILEDIIWSYYPSEDEKLQCGLQWDPLLLPIKQGDKVGKIDLLDPRGNKIFQVDLIAKNNVYPSRSYGIFCVNVLLKASLTVLFLTLMFLQKRKQSDKFF